MAYPLMSWHTVWPSQTEWWVTMQTDMAHANHGRVNKSTLRHCARTGHTLTNLLHTSQQNFQNRLYEWVFETKTNQNCCLTLFFMINTANMKWFLDVLMWFKSCFCLLFSTFLGFLFRVASTLNSGQLNDGPVWIKPNKCP